MPAFSAHKTSKTDVFPIKLFALLRSVARAANLHRWVTGTKRFYAGGLQNRAALVTV